MLDAFIKGTYARAGDHSRGSGQPRDRRRLAPLRIQGAVGNESSLVEEKAFLTAASNGSLLRNSASPGDDL